MNKKVWFHLLSFFCFFGDFSLIVLYFILTVLQKPFRKKGEEFRRSWECLCVCVWVSACVCGCLVCRWPQAEGIKCEPVQQRLASDSAAEAAIRHSDLECRRRRRRYQTLQNTHTHEKKAHQVATEDLIRSNAYGILQTGGDNLAGGSLCPKGRGRFFWQFFGEVFQFSLVFGGAGRHFGDVLVQLPTKWWPEEARRYELCVRVWVCVCARACARVCASSSWLKQGRCGNWIFFDNRKKTHWRIYNGNIV